MFEPRDRDLLHNARMKIRSQHHKRTQVVQIAGTLGVVAGVSSFFFHGGLWVLPCLIAVCCLVIALIWKASLPPEENDTGLIYNMVAVMGTAGLIAICVICRWSSIPEAVQALGPIHRGPRCLEVIESPDITDLHFSPDGSIVVGWSKDLHGATTQFDKRSGRIRLYSQATSGICLWEIATGRKIRRLGNHSFPKDPQFSPDGKHIVSIVDGYACMWDIATGAQLRRWQIEGIVRAFTFHGNESVLAVTDKLRNQLAPCLDRYSVQTGKRISSYELTKRHWTEVKFSEDGSLVIGIGGTSFAVFTSAGKQQCEMRLDFTLLKPAVISASKDVIAILLDGEIRIISVTSQHEICRFSVDDDQSDRLFTLLALSRSGNMIAIGEADGSIGLWDVHGQKLIKKLRGSKDPISDLVFSPDETMLASANSKEIRVWKLNERF